MLNVRLPSNQLSNGVVYELWKMVGSCKCTNQVRSFIKAVGNHFDLSVVDCKEKTVHSQVLKVVKTRRSLAKLKSKEKLCYFLRQESGICKPKSEPPPTEEDATAPLEELTRLQQQQNQLQRDFADLKEKNTSQSKLLEDVLAERIQLMERVKQLERDVTIERQVAKDSQTRTTRLVKASSQNIRRREYRKAERIVKLKQQLKGLNFQMKRQSKSHTNTLANTQK